MRFLTLNVAMFVWVCHSLERIRSDKIFIMCSDVHRYRLLLPIITVLLCVWLNVRIWDFVISTARSDDEFPPVVTIKVSKMDKISFRAPFLISLLRIMVVDAFRLFSSSRFPKMDLGHVEILPLRLLTSRAASTNLEMDKIEAFQRRPLSMTANYSCESFSLAT